MLTQIQIQAHERHVAFHAKLAKLALRVVPKPDSTFTIPNTPFGVPKIRPVVEKPQNVVLQEVYGPFKPLFYIVDELEPEEPVIRRPTIIEIQRAIAKHFNCSCDDMISERRTAGIVLPRQIAVYLCRHLTLRSLPEIGRKFGGRDHATILHAIRKVDRLLPVDPDIACAVATIIAHFDPERRG